MLKKMILAMALVAGYYSANAQQQVHPIDAELERCKQEHPSALGSIECEIMAYQKWNAEMERLYNVLLTQLDEPSKLVLKEEQLAWAKYRDVHFEFYEKFYGPKMGFITLIASSKTNFVRDRVRELQIYLNSIGQR
jgi:uncharacterized protein YecT (DUF1311 family)